MVVVLALTVAEVATWVVVRMAVPLVLMILSIVFGKGMRRAAESTSAAGKTAADAIGRARRGFRRIGQAPRARVEVVDTTGERVRVEAPADDAADGGGGRRRGRHRRTGAPAALTRTAGRTEARVGEVPAS